MADTTDLLSRRHFAFGWWTLLIFLSMGIVLEAMHGLKIGWYMSVANETRRLLWTLAHAHGTLLALVHVAFAVTLGRVALTGRRLEIASRCLMAASVLLPGGFFLGGLVIYDGDAGLGVLLVPAGALLLVVGVGIVAAATRARRA